MTSPKTDDDRCLHEWQPYADAVRIWTVCAKCGTEEHVTTHAEQTAQAVRYIFADVGG